MKIFTIVINFSLTTMCMMATGVGSETQNLISNGDFEITHKITGTASKNVGFGAWVAGANKRIPNTWILNAAYPGTATIVEEGAHSGKKFLNINANISNKTHRGAHLYYPSSAIKADKCYRVTARIRGGKVSIGFYEYHKTAPFRLDVVCSETAPIDEWHEITGYYRPSGDDFIRAFPAIIVAWGDKVDIDDLNIKEVSAKEAGENNKNITFSNDVMRIDFSPLGKLQHFICKETGKDYAVTNTTTPLCQIKIKDLVMESKSISRRDDLIDIGFADSKVKVTLRVKSHGRYFTFEIVDVQPADAQWMNINFPMKRLSTHGKSFAANYDDTFAACAFALKFKAFCKLKEQKEGEVSIVAEFTDNQGFKGGEFALLGVPRKEFSNLIQQVERDAGLPSPKLDGVWLRDCEPIQRSYIFAIELNMDAKKRDKDIDKLIKYAKLGHFQTIIFDRYLWLDTHGHYKINERIFPGGIKEFKRIADKIHAAGLKVGVHLFGPSISPNDPYVTPVPDKRLESVLCPPLAKAIDTAAKVITLQAPPQLVSNIGFPEKILRIGDELITYEKIEPGTPFRFVGCTRGAHGTKASEHVAGALVRGMITKLGFFMLKPDSELLDEVTSNFAKVVNYCGLDMVYFDASDCAIHAKAMGGYSLYNYVEKCHLDYYRKFDHDVIYQTSVGLGFNMLWHIVARGASANGSGDIKKYLDKRMYAVGKMRRNFHYADVGWYMLDPTIKLDAFEYIIGKCMASDASVSVQTSRAILERHPNGREMLETIGLYERCRLASSFPKPIKEAMLEKQKNFKLFNDGKGHYKLFRADYQPKRFIARLDGKDNAWTINNPLDKPCKLGFRVALTPDNNNPNAEALQQNFKNLELFNMSKQNQYEKLVKGIDKVITPAGPARKGVEPKIINHYNYRTGGTYAVYMGTNNNATQKGWCAMGRRFSPLKDISNFRTITFWLLGAGEGSQFALQLWDTKGRFYEWTVNMNFATWQFFQFDIPQNVGVDWSKIEYMILRYNDIPPKTYVFSRIEGIRVLPGVDSQASISDMEFTVNGKRHALPDTLKAGQTLTNDSLGNCFLWPGGMTKGIVKSAPQSVIELKPDKNKIEFKCKLHNFPRTNIGIRLLMLSPLAEADIK